MKKIFTLLLVFTLANMTFGQGFKDKKEKIKALKVAYITEKLDLTTDEAQKFWPIYNAFDEKQFENRHFKRRKSKEEMDNISEKEAQNLIAEMQKNEEEMYQLKKQFIIDLQKVLPAKKIILLRKTEDEFNRKLLREFRERRP